MSDALTLDSQEVGGHPPVEPFLERLGVRDNSDGRTLRTRLIVRVVEEFGIDLGRVHIDSTSVDFPVGTTHLRRARTAGGV